MKNWVNRIASSAETAPDAGLGVEKHVLDLVRTLALDPLAASGLVPCMPELIPTLRMLLDARVPGEDDAFASEGLGSFEPRCLDKLTDLPG